MQQSQHRHIAILITRSYMCVPLELISRRNYCSLAKSLDIPLENLLGIPRGVVSKINERFMFQYSDVLKFQDLVFCLAKNYPNNMQKLGVLDQHTVQYFPLKRIFFYLFFFIGLPVISEDCSKGTSKPILTIKYISTRLDRTPIACFRDVKPGHHGLF